MQCAIRRGDTGPACRPQRAGSVCADLPRQVIRVVPYVSGAGAGLLARRVAHSGNGAMDGLVGDVAQAGQLVQGAGLQA